MVNVGEAQLWRLDPSTYMVTRVVARELVVICFEGCRLYEHAPAIIAAAARQGLRGIRCHSRRPGMGRFLAPLGFRFVREVEPGERVYYLPLH